MNPDFQYFEQFSNFETRRGHIRDFKLETMEALLDSFSNPHKDLTLVHIAGSKGKGSTSAYTGALLSDYLNTPVGLYASPHVHDYRERIRCAQPGMIRITEGFFPDHIYKEQIRSIMQYIDNLEDGAEYPSTFELLTLLAFMVFRKAGIQTAVIEVGLGGRLDSTNVITPYVCGITPIEMEHAQYLGDTLEKIAAEKAGIIKPGTTVISAEQHAGAQAILQQKADTVGASFSMLKDVDDLPPNTTMPIPGYLEDNARLARALFLACMGNEDFTPPRSDEPKRFLKEHWREIILRTRLPGRYELRKLPGCRVSIILDAAHTPNSLRRFIAALKQDGSMQVDSMLKENGETSYTRNSLLPLCIFSAIQDKEREQMISILVENFQHIIFTGTGSFKPTDPDELASIAEKIAKNTGTVIQSCASAAEALEYACEAGHPAAACGSFYLLGELYPLLEA